LSLSTNKYSKIRKVNQLLFCIDLLLFIVVMAASGWSKVANITRTISNQTTTTNTQTYDIAKQYTIGWSSFDNGIEHFYTIQEGVLDKAEELGIRVVTHDEKSNTTEMVSGVTQLLQQDIDALVISPYNPEVLSDIVKQAKEKGIPVIVVDVGTGGSEVDASILSDSFGGGVLAGEYAIRLIKEYQLTSKNAAIIQVKESSEFARRRGEGFKNVMQEAGFNIATIINAESERENAYRAMKELLETYGDDIAVVFTENDPMALGAAQAIDEVGKKGQIMVIGFNGDPTAIQAIKEGYMQGTIAQRPYEMGQLGVELVYTLLTNGEITYDDSEKKELYTEIYLIDQTGKPHIDNGATYQFINYQ
jgi:ribose transport system substrate-binding protein